MKPASREIYEEALRRDLAYSIPYDERSVLFESVLVQAFGALHERIARIESGTVSEPSQQEAAK